MIQFNNDKSSVGQMMTGIGQISDYFDPLEPDFARRIHVLVATPQRTHISSGRQNGGSPSGKNSRKPPPLHRQLINYETAVFGIDITDSDRHSKKSACQHALFEAKEVWPGTGELAIYKPNRSNVTRSEEPQLAESRRLQAYFIALFVKQSQNSLFIESMPGQRKMTLELGRLSLKILDGKD